MTQLFNHNGKWLNLEAYQKALYGESEAKEENAKLVETDNGEEELVKDLTKVDEKIEEVPVDVALEDLRIQYKESHPEKKDVPNNKKNDLDWIQNKVSEFNKLK